MRVQGVPVVSFSGDLVRETLAVLSKEIEPHLTGSAPGLVIDVADVGFVSSEGLGLLIRVGKTLEDQGRVLALAALPRSVERMMRAIGLDKVFPIFRGVAEARTWVAQRATHEL